MELVSYFKNQKLMGSGLSFFVPFFLYLGTLSTEIAMGDSGELVSAACTLGVPHPPGFPLYVLVGKLFCWLPISTAAFRLNLMSAGFGAGTSWILFQILVKFIRPWIALLSALILATQATFWEVSIEAEVYTLHTFLICLIFWLGINFVKLRELKILFWISFLFGLGFSNHWPLVVLILPSLLYLVFPIPLKKLGLCILLFGVGLAPYILLPLSSSFSSGMDWGHPRNLTNLVIHVLRLNTTETHVGWTPMESLRLISYFCSEFLIKGFGWMGLPIAFYGISRYAIHRKIIGAATLAFLIPSIVMLAWLRIPWNGSTVNAAIVPFSAVSFFLAILIGFGADGLWERVTAKRDLVPPLDEPSPTPSDNFLR